MPAGIHQLVSARSALAVEIAQYLKTVIREATSLEHVECPSHPARDCRTFGTLLQQIQVSRYGVPSCPPITWDARDGVRYPRSVVVGERGAGKTWLLRYEALKTAQRSLQQWEQRQTALSDIRLPILINLPSLEGEMPFFENVVVQAARDRSKMFSSFVAEQIRNGRCVLLIDAFGELGPLHRRWVWAWRLRSALRSQFRRCDTMLTLLESDYRLLFQFFNPVGHAAPVLRLLGFREETCRAFVSAWFSTTPTGFWTKVALWLDTEGVSRVTPLWLREVCRTKTVPPPLILRRQPEARSKRSALLRTGMAAGILICAVLLLWIRFGRLTITSPENRDKVPHACEVRGRRPIWEPGVVVSVRSEDYDRWWSATDVREGTLGRWEATAEFGRPNDDVGVVYTIIAECGGKTSTAVRVTRQ